MGGGGGEGGGGGVGGGEGGGGGARDGGSSRGGGAGLLVVVCESGVSGGGSFGKADFLASVKGFFLFRVCLFSCGSWCISARYD